MHLTERFVATITYVVSFFSLFGIENVFNRQQAPIFDSSVELHNAVATNGPVFKPPTGRPSNKPGGDLVCDYSAMGPDWYNCSTTMNRGCWLKNKRTGEEYNISTDYEDPKKLPLGIHRYYTLNLTNGSINADGLNFKEGKFFWNTSDPDSWKPENRYPGPWVQACWGDTVHVNVINNLTFNGTSVHWHGIRQLNTSEMDGVPGVTQCPIAPHDNFTYSWTARQYGSSWYHSHFSLQYADGALGPLTIHGPTSDDWDEPKNPILMTDWGHNSAFQAIWPNGPGLVNQSTLLNGKGNVTRFNNNITKDTRPDLLDIPAPHNITLASTKKPNRAKRYLLRLINTSFESIFIFSVDSHMVTVVSADFVPIHPYNTTNVTIGIGQRYNVILIADPVDSTATSFWMRAYRPTCFNLNKDVTPSDGYERVGIVFYDGETKYPDPKTKGWPIVTSPDACADEPYHKLVPYVNWTVGGDPKKVEDDLAVQLSLGANGKPAFDPGRFPLALFSIGGKDFNPLTIDYSDPIFLHLGYTGKWNPRWVVYPESYSSDDWVYLVLKGTVVDKTYSTGGAHPIHLHGHDFAIVDQVYGRPFDPKNFHPKLNNPPRRDVVLLPVNGYAVIAFRTDNPGPWIMHCHIAQHASFGLALQVMERQTAALDTARKHGAITQVQETCNKWNKWWGDCTNWWWDENPAANQSRGHWCDYGMDAFSPDSGI